MNKRQRVVIWAGLAVFVLMALFPPVNLGGWVYPIYAFIGSSYVSVLDYKRLLMQWTVVVVAVGTLFWVFKAPWDGETRCRKCGYILRGISEPRCPECGERI
jgi:hypothetical protein